MNTSYKNSSDKCDVCGAMAQSDKTRDHYFDCHFCGFKTLTDGKIKHQDDNLIYAIDVNKFFQNKYSELNKGDVFELSVPVSRFYKTPATQPNQINFFKSKNIMFLLEQHGFQMVKRKSRFSTTLDLIVRKI